MSTKGGTRKGQTPPVKSSGRNSTLHLYDARVPVKPINSNAVYAKVKDKLAKNKFVIFQASNDANSYQLERSYWLGFIRGVIITWAGVLLLVTTIMVLARVTR